MKRLLSIAFICISISLLGQERNKNVQPGKVEKSDIQLKECDFDRNADAEILLNVEEVKCREYTYSLDMDVKRTVRIKILNNKGLSWADVKIPYYKYENTEKIVDINAKTYNLDGAGNLLITPIEQKSIFDREITKRVSEKIFTFQDVKIGSVLEYSYMIKGPMSTGLRTWNFQSSIPVKFSRYTIDFPASLELEFKPYCIIPLDTQSVSNSNNKIFNFIMTNVPALRNEPFMSCEDDYVQRLEPKVVASSYFGSRNNLTTSWGGIVRSLMRDEDFGQQLEKSIPRTSDLDEILKKINDPILKMAIIYRYVQHNMQWNGRTNIWALDGVKTAWKQKRGTSGEINLILVNLLKGANLEAYPILVSTRENGRIDTRNPGYSQFDKVMAYVTIGSHSYCLDATNKYASHQLIPFDVMYTLGLVVKKFETFEWGWVTLWDSKQALKDIILINGSIDDRGLMTADATITSIDYSRIKRIQDWKSGKDKFVEKYFGSLIPAISIDSLSVLNEDDDTLPFVQKIKFNKRLSASGDYYYFSPNLFTGLEKNPFTAENRFSDICFGANQHYTIMESYIIPEGFSFDEMPKNMRMIMPDTSVIFTRMIQAQGDLLSLRIEIEFKRPLYIVEEYGNFKEFYKKLFGFLNEQIVIKKIKR
jgi:Domain of Unknown Function with PDB structure (DUF3857)